MLDVVCAGAALLVPGRHSAQYVDHFEEAAAG